MDARSLAHLRFPVEQSGGRRYPELPHTYRNDFQRYRDRIIHARAFRRLEDKTQVFTPGLSDHFRNRLTHTIEVSQIARTIAASLGLNEDLTEALALAHDIGHPPFAHSGEEELDRQMRRFGDRFDHNLHSLRILEIFEQRYARFPGLNLTFVVREGIAKHSRDFELGEFPELDEYLPGMRPPLEAQLIDIADEIAYNTADLDDAYQAGMLTLEDMIEEIPFYAEIYDPVELQFAGAPERVRFLEALRGLIDWLATGFIEGTAAAVRASGVARVNDVRICSQRLAVLSEGPRETNAALKTFLRTHVYYCQALTEERARSTARVSELFRYLLEHPECLKDSWQEPGAPLHRVVCDYIAGMTDGYFGRVYAQLIG